MHRPRPSDTPARPLDEAIGEFRPFRFTLGVGMEGLRSLARHGTTALDGASWPTLWVVDLPGGEDAAPGIMILDVPPTQDSLAALARLAFARM
jgi:hypothetical protein